jgi:hypothetical protein
MKKLLCAAAFGPAFAFGGIASAGEPVVLDDAALENVTAAGLVDFTTLVFKAVDILVDVNVNIDKNVSSFVDITGNLATAEASADAIGFDTLSETESFAQVISGEFSQSFSSSVAATDFNFNGF